MRSRPCNRHRSLGRDPSGQRGRAAAAVSAPAAGFEEGIRGEQIRLDRAIGTTTPDVIYRAAHHGGRGRLRLPRRAERPSPRQPRDCGAGPRDPHWLRNNGYDVIEIAASDLHDEGAMQRHFRRLAGYLRADYVRARVQTDTSWFGRGDRAAAQPARFVPRIVRPKPAERYQNCVPLVPRRLRRVGSASDKTPANPPTGSGLPSTRAIDCIRECSWPRSWANPWNRRFLTALCACSDHQSKEPAKARPFLCSFMIELIPSTGGATQ